MEFQSRLCHGVDIMPHYRQISFLSGVSIPHFSLLAIACRGEKIFRGNRIPVIASLISEADTVEI